MTLPLATVNPHGRPHPEEFQNWFHETSWNVLRERGYLWAAYIWNMFDFASDSRSEGDLTDINDKGLVSYDRRTRKDAFCSTAQIWSGHVSFIWLDDATSIEPTVSSM